MGVKGLLPALRTITKPIKLERYRGLTAAIDAMSWLHKGIFADDVRSIAFQSNASTASSQQKSEQTEKRSKQKDTVVKRLDFDDCLDSNVGEKEHKSNFLKKIPSIESPSKCVMYVLKRVDRLRREYGIEVVLVIDGAPLPSKRRIDEARRANRKRAFEEALQAEKRGDRTASRRLFGQACSISYEMRYELIQHCRLMNVPFIVAPYEADSQMARLALGGTADLIITEDSDLLAYGCPRVLFKIDFDTGRGDEIQLMRDLASNDTLNFRHWTHDMFVYLCILAGCDYCEGIPGLGIKTAHKLVRMHRTPKKIFKALKAAGRMPDQFQDNFVNAYRTFRHQFVYSLERQVVEPLHPIDIRVTNYRSEEEATQNWSFLGTRMTPDIGRGIALGDLHPKYKMPWNSKVPDLNICREEENEPPNERTHSASNPKRSTAGPKLKKELFGFRFPKRTPEKTNRKHTSEEHNESKRVPPLQEIHLNPRLVTADKDSLRRIPIRCSDYSSKLVGSAFKPLQTRTRRGEKRNVGRVISQLRARLSRDASNAKVDKTSSFQSTNEQIDKGSIHEVEQRQSQTSKSSIDEPGNITRSKNHRRSYSNATMSPMLQPYKTSRYEEQVQDKPIERSHAGSESQWNSYNEDHILSSEVIDCTMNNQGNITMTDSDAFRHDGLSHGDHWSISEANEYNSKDDHESATFDFSTGTEYMQEYVSDSRSAVHSSSRHIDPNIGSEKGNGQGHGWDREFMDVSKLPIYEQKQSKHAYSLQDSPSSKFHIRHDAKTLLKDEYEDHGCRKGSTNDVTDGDFLDYASKYSAADTGQNEISMIKYDEEASEIRSSSDIWGYHDEDVGKADGDWKEGRVYGNFNAHMEQSRCNEDISDFAEHRSTNNYLDYTSTRRDEAVLLDDQELINYYDNDSGCNIDSLYSARGNERASSSTNNLRCPENFHGRCKIKETRGSDLDRSDREASYLESAETGEFGYGLIDNSLQSDMDTFMNL